MFLSSTQSYMVALLKNFGIIFSLITFGELLKQVIKWLYAFWPLRVVHDWEPGVRCLLGNATARLTSENGLGGTGLH